MIIVCWSIVAPTIVKAAAQVQITQEEIEAILERDKVSDISSTSLPADLKRRLGQAIASSTDAITPAISDTIEKAGQAVATATNKVSSTSDKIKDNLENYGNQAKSDLKNTFLGAIADTLSSIWKTIAHWFSGFFRGKPLGGSTT